MKKLLLILLCLPMIGFGQQTYVPDDNFEQELINLGYDSVLDDSVLTSNINTVTFLDISSQLISNLSGIEGFTALNTLWCNDNMLNSIDVSNNIYLTGLRCQGMNLTNLDISNNINLSELVCSNNQLTSLDLSSNTLLNSLVCSNNQLTSLNLNNNTLLTGLLCQGNQLITLDFSFNLLLENLTCSNNQLTSINLNLNTSLISLSCAYNNLTSLSLDNNISLTSLRCSHNQISSLNIAQNTLLYDFVCENNSLTSLDVRNGNNINFVFFKVINNPNLQCINVDDVTWSTNNWTTNNYSIESTMYFSSNCIPSFTQEHTTNKELLKITDLLGKETKGSMHEPLFYIYDDGTVEKRIVIE